MCTVSFLPTEKGCIITSNRDEKSLRGAACPPKIYPHHPISLLYPKDADAGGSWIGMASNGYAAVLLNGAFRKHVPRYPYRKSRGLVFLDLLSAPSPVEACLNASLEGIEPFTMVIWENQLLHEFRWDGQVQHHHLPATDRPHIWSSVTLYPENVVAKRVKWFEEWLKMPVEKNREQLLHFHQFGGEGDRQNDLMMNRNGKFFTVSITSMVLDTNQGNLYHLDLLRNQQHEESLSFTHASQLT